MTISDLKLHSEKRTQTTQQLHNTWESVVVSNNKRFKNISIPEDAGSSIISRPDEGYKLPPIKGDYGISSDDDL